MRGLWARQRRSRRGHGKPGYSKAPHHTMVSLHASIGTIGRDAGDAAALLLNNNWADRVVGVAPDPVKSVHLGAGLAAAAHAGPRAHACDKPHR
jgi:hypothetical protein